MLYASKKIVTIRYTDRIIWKEKESILGCEKMMQKLYQNDLKMEPKSLPKVDQKSTKIDPRAQEVPFGAPGPHFGGAGPHF